MAPQTIGLIAEGYTDQLVLQEILLGHFGSDTDVNFVQPQDADPSATGSYDPGGWTVLFAYLREGGPRDALQFNDAVARANKLLKKKNAARLSKADGTAKAPEVYRKLARKAFRKPKNLAKHAPRNPSLRVFVESLPDRD